MTASLSIGLCRVHPIHPMPPGDHPAQAPTPIPLEHVAVTGRIVGASAEVTLTQRFRNIEARPIEAVYVFPLPSDAAVTGFTATIGDRIVEGRVEERERAFELYDDAMAEGHGAYLLDSERPNIFTVSVGNLPPGQTVGITLRWALRLEREGEAIRFQLPTTVSPRYVPASTPKNQIGEPDGERVNPVRAAEVPYGLELLLRLEGGRPRRVASPTHPIDLTWLADGAEVRLARELTALDRDLVLLIEPEAPSRPEAIVACDATGQRFVQVEFVPSAPKVDSGHEVIFVVDCSGSMQGDSIAQARRALELCIRTLGERDTFDIVNFGSTHQALFGRAEGFTSATLERAVRHLAATDANMGGTEILPALASVTGRPTDALRPRQILILTDGQVSNEAETIAHASTHAERARIFSFGIGAGVSEHLVRELARVTRGQVEMIVPGERIEPKVLRQFGRLRTPTLAGVTIDWGGLVVTQSPAVVPPIFEGDPLCVWARVESGAAQRVVLRGGGLAWEVPIDLERARPAHHPLAGSPATGSEADPCRAFASGLGPIPAMWARSRIRELENEPERAGSAQARATQRTSPRERQLVELGKRYGLLSSVTSYVAVELRAADARTREAAELRKVPIALTAGWGGTAAGSGIPTGVPTTTQAGIARGGSVNMMFGTRKTMAGVAAPPPPSFAPPAPAPKTPAPMEPALVRARSAPGYAPASTPAPAKDAVSGAAGGLLAQLKQKAKALLSTADRETFAECALAEETAGTPGAPGTNNLYDVLLTQAADGHFPASNALTAWLGARRPTFDAVAARIGADVAWTLCALAYLETAASAQADEWRAAATKAAGYLASAQAPLDVAGLRRELGI